MAVYPDLDQEMELVFSDQPSVDPMNTRADDARHDPNSVLNSDSQQTRTREAPGGQHRKSGIPISLEDIEQQFGKKLKDAAESLGVSRSTLKRACREHNILWWHFGKRSQRPSTSYGSSVEVVALDPVPCSNMSLTPLLDSLHQPPLDADTSRFQQCLPSEGANNVVVKVMYGDKFAIKFKLSLSSGIEVLQQEVLKRLNWVDFKAWGIQYKDEDNDWILIACNEDLQHYMSSSTSSGKTTITLHLKTFEI